MEYTSKEVEKITPYLELRWQMQTGDALLWKGYGIGSWLIRKLSKGNFSHAGLVIAPDEFESEQNRRWTMEALAQGVVLRLLSRALVEYNGECWWYPLRDIYNTNRDAVGKYAMCQAGIGYDYDSLVKQAIFRVTPDARKQFCSEHCFLAWKHAGIPILSRLAPRPGDIPFLGIFKKPVRIL